MELGLQEVGEFLTGHIGSEISGLELLPGGHWPQAFGFHTDGRDLVVRFGRHIEDFRKDRAAGLLRSTGLPIPEVLDMGTGPGGYFCISQRVFGEMLDNLDGVRMELVVPSVLRTLDALREADLGPWDAEVGAPAASWVDQLLSVDEENERVFGWHDRMASSPTGVEPYGKALAFLRAELSFFPDGKHLVHNDLLHNNVIVSNDAIVGVIDWGNAMRGDFLYDLAMFTFYAPWFKSMGRIDWLKEAKEHYRALALDVPALDNRLCCYEVHLGLSGMAYAAFKSNWHELEANARRTMLRLDS